MQPTPNEALRIAIVRSTLTQRAVAKAARLHEARFSGIVRGRIIPNEHEQARIALALNTTVADLFGPSAADADDGQLVLPLPGTAVGR